MPRAKDSKTYKNTPIRDSTPYIIEFTTYFRANMTQTTASKSRWPCRDSPLCLDLGVNVRGRPRSAIKYRATQHPRRRWQATQDVGIQRQKDLRSENWVKRCQRPKELSAMHPEVFDWLEMKECVFEVQKILLRKLASEENRQRGLAEAVEALVAESDHRIPEEERRACNSG